MSDPVATRKPCTTCNRPWVEGEFYTTGSECKACKRGRSKLNRAEQARKLALAERFIDVLAAMSAKADSPQHAADILRAAPSAKIRAARTSPTPSRTEGLPQS